MAAKPKSHPPVVPGTRVYTRWCFMQYEVRQCAHGQVYIVNRELLNEFTLSIEDYHLAIAEGRFIKTL